MLSGRHVEHEGRGGCRRNIKSKVSTLLTSKVPSRRMKGQVCMTCILLLLFLIFSHFYVGSMCLMRFLHLARSCMSSLDNSFSDKSFPMVSIHLRFGLPLLLFPGTSIPITLLPTSTFVFSSQYHFNLLSFLHFLGYFSHLRCPSNSFNPNSVQLGDSTHPS